MANLTPAQTINAVAPYQGIIEWKGQPSQGVSQQTGNAWANVDFVLKYLNHNMREEFICFTLSGPENVNKLMATPEGTQVKVWWRPQARKWQDAQGQIKWFPQFVAFSIQPVAPETDPSRAQQMPAQQQAQPVYQQAQTMAAPTQPAYQQAPPQAPAMQAAPAPAPANNGYQDLPFD